MHALYEALATEGRDPAVAVTRTVESNRGDPAMTARLLERLNGAVTARGARLVVVAAPSKLEFVKGVRYEPYQRKLEAICTDLKIGFLDLAPALRRSILRTYLRTDMHWTAHGNAVAADAIHDLIVELLQASDGSGAG
jgi:hypothetical protein